MLFVTSLLHVFVGTPVEHRNLYQDGCKVPRSGGRIRIPPPAAFQLRLNRKPESLVSGIKNGETLIAFPRSNLTGTPGRIRTCGLRIRSPALYPAELRAHGWMVCRYFGGYPNSADIKKTQGLCEEGSPVCLLAR